MNSFDIGKEACNDYSTIIYTYNNSNVVIQTDVNNIEIKKILEKFLLSYDNSMNVKRPATKYFLKYFAESMKNTHIEKDKCFNDQSFYEQYKFYTDLDITLRQNEGLLDVEKLRNKLVAFYRYLINEEDIEVYRISCSEIFKDSISSKTFYKYYEEGYKFFYHDTHEHFPKEDKICILPNRSSINNADSKNISRKSYDFTKCDIRYRDDLKEFVWNNWSGANSLNHYNDLVNFLNFSKYIQYSENIINLEERDKEFSSEFLWLYRNKIISENKNTNNVKAIFKIVRKYLKYYSNKYNVIKLDFNIIPLSKLGVSNGGYIITERDRDAIYRCFKENEKKDIKYKLYTIVFEFFLTTKYRIGEILNLRRNCLTKLSDGSYKIRYLGKTTEKNFVEEKLTKESAKLLIEAINITDELVIDAGLVKEFIFIEKYKTKHIKKCKIINFRYEFKKIINELEAKSELDNRGYTVNNIRHTFIDNVYKEGRKQDLSLNTLSIIAGNGYKTARKHYRDANDLLDYIEATNGICIADVDVEGNILKTENIQKNNEVKSGLGNCKVDSCNFEIGECLICKNFITFTNREIVFENKVKEIDEKINYSNNPDEIDELNAYKELLVRYIYKIKEINLERGNND
ncbi:MAG: tyrosine-type recombinase/integrase [Clostridium sp.]|uniref:tyrosine-type recombinase/integrase n=1 Tax=Clostridium sp. TaxID=1506 RepID=UPI002A840ABD|nr:tyrosine-type recombinase/integrase [Clostridium sp.]MCI6693372.1 tyrosine-type recombinase/integrase [Clostridium sp.]MDY4253505.1 tyrosine-type recombinase/integrase [Clostridium sp.]MDY6228150.1 tyrosine-type recombinase/integrase [Clostridium sp.]